MLNPPSLTGNVVVFKVCVLRTLKIVKSNDFFLHLLLYQVTSISVRKSQ